MSGLRQNTCSYLLVYLGVSVFEHRRERFHRELHTCSPGSASLHTFKVHILYQNSSISCVMFTDPQLWDHRQGPPDGPLMMDPDVSVLLHCAVWRGLLESQVQVDLSERFETVYFIYCASYTM